jgi:hypothetical protein
MTNEAFHKLCIGFNATYTYNDKFREYVDANFKGKTNLYGDKEFSNDDMKAARKFWKANQKNHPNYPWFDLPYDAYEWIDNMPVGGYEY